MCVLREQVKLYAPDYEAKVVVTEIVSPETVIKYTVELLFATTSH